MFKSYKKNLLEFKHKNSTPLPSSNGKGRKDSLRIKKIKQMAILQNYKDINGMEVTHVVIKEKIQSLFDVDYNKSTKTCNPCMNVCKKVNNKINGRKLSKVSNNEMKKLIKVFSS